VKERTQDFLFDLAKQTWVRIGGGDGSVIEGTTQTRGTWGLRELGYGYTL